MASDSPGQAGPPCAQGGEVRAGNMRAMNLALWHQIANRIGIPRPLLAAELTAIRSAVEDHFEAAAAGVTAVDVEGGWTAEEALEQHGLSVAMDMMVAGLPQPTAATPTNLTALHAYRVVCDDNFDTEAETLFVFSFTTIADAIRCAQDIVDEFLADEYKSGIAAETLYDQYMSFGDDPWIKVPGGVAPVPFSAWDYAKQRCVDICGGGLS